MKLPAELFARYLVDPNGMDAEVRKAANVPDNRYYNVATFPDWMAGEVNIDPHLDRHFRPDKISKSR